MYNSTPVLLFLVGRRGRKCRSFGLNLKRRKVGVEPRRLGVGTEESSRNSSGDAPAIVLERTADTWRVSSRCPVAWMRRDAETALSARHFFYPSDSRRNIVWRTGRRASSSRRPPVDLGALRPQSSSIIPRAVSSRFGLAAND